MQQNNLNSSSNITRPRGYWLPWSAGIFALAGCAGTLWVLSEVLEIDSDNDGWTDAEEIIAGTEQRKSIAENTSEPRLTRFPFLSGVYPEHKISVVEADLEVITKKVVSEYSGRSPGRGDIELCDWNNRPLKDFPRPPTCHDVLQSLRACMSDYHVPNVCVEDENYFYAWYAGETFQGNIIDKKHFRRHGWEMNSEKIEFIGD